jgi:hypothetical protein
MSQQLRSVLIAAGLTAALLLAVPAPSRAAALREPALSSSLMDRVWSWLEGLLPGAPASQPAPKGPAGRKTLLPPPPPPPLSDQGSMIDPDGRH